MHVPIPFFQRAILILDSLMISHPCQSANRVRILDLSRFSTLTINLTSPMGSPSYLHQPIHTFHPPPLCCSSSLQTLTSTAPILRQVPTRPRKVSLDRSQMAIMLLLAVSPSMRTVLLLGAIPQVPTAISPSLASATIPRLVKNIQ